MSVLAVIPARGGSKGIPRKNLREVAGKPLIVWTIEQALAARPTMDVVVSTDDAEIAEVARAAGARVPFLRPAELAQDTTATEPVVLHALAQARAEGSHPQAVMLLQATSPVRLPGTLTRALDEFGLALPVVSWPGWQRPTLLRPAATAAATGPRSRLDPLPRDRLGLPHARPDLG